MTQLLRSLTALLLAACLGAQVDVAKEEADLNKKASTALASFASNAIRNKMGPRAKQAYDLVLDHYDIENAVARKALGFTKVAGKWEPADPKKAPVWVDKANNDERYKVVDEWYKTAVKLGQFHRDLGVKLKAAGNARAEYHLQRAVTFNPADKDAHLALGHREFKGFYGTDEEIAFVSRMKEIETQALNLARTAYEVQALSLDSMPKELKATGLEFHGSKSQHFTIWTRGTQENADNCAKWAERALAFLGWLIGPDQAKRRNIANRMKAFSWFGFVWTSRERDDFLKLNPHIYQGSTLEEAKRFANVSWRSDQGAAMVLMKLTPAQMHDALIAWVFQLGLAQGLNDALGEGLKNAATWYLQSTSITQFGAIPEGTGSERELQLPESTNWWLRKIRDDSLAGTDWPLNQVPRERLSRFRNAVRIKSWSFMTWVLAKYPDKWLDFYAKVPADKIPFPEEIDKIGLEAFGKPLSEVEAEWRQWARGDSGVAFATGYGPPLLPEKPNKEELAALDRMNAVRGTLCAYSLPAAADAKDTVDMREGTVGPLPRTELDAETSIACEDHARYLTRYPDEHLKWPEAHEQNPANEGFSPRGMRAGMRGVIIWTNGDPGPEFSRDSVDGWIGTVYHRFPLLEHNINRFGFSYVSENGYAIGVLDMGSLEEPYDPMTAPKLIAWPPIGMKEVPRRFHGVEHPNPLDDQPEDQRDITKTGYPVSLQLQREYAGQLVEADMAMYEVKNAKAKMPTKHYVAEGEPGHGEWRARRGEIVPLWVHTPKDPLLKRMEEKEVIFGIPKAILAPKTTYQVEAKVVAGNNQALYFCWEFTTGSQLEGLKF